MSAPRARAASLLPMDLAVRAAHVLKAATATPLGAALRIEKRIPIGGGLGGGSSDAATTLLALNGLWSCGLTVPQLAALGLPLGADVPVFVQGFSAWAEGVGERLSPQALPPRWYLIIHPGVAVSTREVFQSPELTRNSPLITIRAFFRVRRPQRLRAGGAGALSRSGGGAGVAGGAGARPADGHGLVHIRRVRERDRSRAPRGAGSRSLAELRGARARTARPCTRSLRAGGEAPAAVRCAPATKAGDADAGVSPSGKAAGFDPAIRRFESFHPSQFHRGPARLERAPGRARESRARGA